MTESPSTAETHPEIILVEETGAGRYQVEVHAGATTFLVDEPRAFGGLGSGPNPYDLICAALGACTVMTVRLYAERKAWPVAHVKARVHHVRGTLQARDACAGGVTAWPTSLPPLPTMPSTLATSRLACRHDLASY